MRYYATQGATKLQEVKVEGLEQIPVCMHWGDNFFYTFLNVYVYGILSSMIIKVCSNTFKVFF